MAATRDVILTFRVTAQERREVQLLARAEKVTRSALLRDLLRAAVRRATEEDGRAVMMDG